MWDRRFAEQPCPTDPDPFLVGLAGALPTGRGLDFGAGPGRNSLWLAAKGWDMTLVDASKVGLEQAAAALETRDRRTGDSPPGIVSASEQVVVVWASKPAADRHQ